MHPNDRSLVARFDESTLAPGFPGKRFNASLIEDPTSPGAFLFCYRDGWAGSEIWLVRLDATLKPQGEPWRLELHHHLEANYGREDPQLFMHHGRVHVAYVGVVGPETILHTSVMLARLTADCLRVEDRWYPYYPGRNAWEKNWQPFSRNGQLYAVYSVAPHRVLRIDGHLATMAHETPTPAPWAWGEVRGGSAPVLVGDEWWCFFHSSFNGPHGKTYAMGLYTFDADPPFAFRRIVPEPLMVADWGTKPADQYCACVFPRGAALVGKQPVAANLTWRLSPYGSELFGPDGVRLAYVWGSDDLPERWSWRADAGPGSGAHNGPCDGMSEAIFAAEEAVLSGLGNSKTAPRGDAHWLVSMGVHDRWAEVWKLRHSALEGMLAECVPPPWWRWRGGEQSPTRELEEYASLAGHDAYKVRGLDLKGKAVIDIGAHTGSFARLALSRGAGKVHCYEPDHESAALCVENLAGQGDFIVFQEGLSAKTGPLSLKPLPGNGPLDVLASPDEGGGIPGVTLDAMVERAAPGGGRVALVKFDCEGAEWEGVAAARELGRIDRIAGEFHRATPEKVALLREKLTAAGMAHEVAFGGPTGGFFFAWRSP